LRPAQAAAFKSSTGLLALLARCHPHPSCPHETSYFTAQILTSSFPPIQAALLSNATLPAPPSTLTLAALPSLFHSFTQPFTHPPRTYRYAAKLKGPWEKNLVLMIIKMAKAGDLAKVKASYKLTEKGKKEAKPKVCGLARQSRPFTHRATAWPPHLCGIPPSL
jgi:hypothetical protein